MFYEDLGNGLTRDLMVKDNMITDVRFFDGNIDPIATIEGNGAPIFIEGPGEGVEIGNGIVNLIKQGLKFIFENGSIVQIASKLATEPIGSVEVPATEGEQPDVKDRRTYLLNGIGNVNPVEDGAPQYMVNLRNIMEETYGFTNTELIGLYQGVELPVGLETVVGAIQFIQDTLPPGGEFQTQIILAEILRDLELGVINPGDTINIIAYSGGGQRLLEAAQFLPVNIDVLMHGAPVIGSVFNSRITNIKQIWGENDPLKFLEPILITLKTLGNFSSNVYPTTWMTNVWHFDLPRLNQWGYHCDRTDKCGRSTFDTTIQELAFYVNSFFESIAT